MLCDEQGIGGDGEYYGGGNNAQLGRINVFYYEAWRNLVDNTPVQKWAKDHYRRTDTNASDPPLQKRQAPILLTSSLAL